MAKHQYKSQKKIINIIKIIVVILIIAIVFNFTKFNFAKINFKNSKKQIINIISELQQKYQTDIEILNCNSITKGIICRDYDQISFDVVEPVLLSNMQINYVQGEVKIKYKNIESKIKNNYLIEKLPISTIIEIENMIYSNYFDQWNIRNDILSIEGKYDNEDFVFEADLRKNRVISIRQASKNIFASYK